MVEYPIQVHEKTQSPSPEERIKAIKYIYDNIHDFGDIKGVWEDLHRLTQDEDEEVRRRAIGALGRVFAYIPDKGEAWEDLRRLTQDEDEDVRENGRCFGMGVCFCS